MLFGGFFKIMICSLGTLGGLGLKFGRSMRLRSLYSVSIVLKRIQVIKGLKQKKIEKIKKKV